MRSSEPAQVSESPSHGLQPAGEKGGRGRLIGRTKGGMNTKLHAVADAPGRPIRMFVTAGPVSDYIGAAAMLRSQPQAEWMLADQGYDADWFRDALKDKGIKACIPGRKGRKKAIWRDKRRYKRRKRIEIMFGRLKDWRRVATGAPSSFSWPSHSPQPSSSGSNVNESAAELCHVGKWRSESLMLVTHYDK